MNCKRLSLLAISVYLVSGALVPTTFAATTAWDIDAAHSSIGFKVRHMMVSNVPGSFKTFTGTLLIDDKDITKSSAEVTISAGSIDTADQKRDDHLRSPDFFDVATHGNITFKTKKVVKAGKLTKMVGDLTMHGVTKETTFDVKELTTPQKNFSGKLIRGLSATGVVNRKDFNMTWNKSLDMGGIAVGEKIDVSIELELVENPEKQKTEEKKS